jgi:obg-like ATPase 1
MKNYLRQKSKYLPPIATWVTTHGGVTRDIIPFSIEFEEKVYSLRSDPAAFSTFLAESKVKSKLEKIITEGKHRRLILSENKGNNLIGFFPGFTKLGLQYYFTGPSPLFPQPTKTRLI